MPIDFPSNPAVNDIYTAGNRIWRWTGVRWESDPLPGEKGKFLVSASAPTPAEEGDAWFDSNTSRTYIYFANAWVEVIGAQGPAGQDAVVPETINSDITLEAGVRYFVDTTSARTLTLPATPIVGDEIQIFDASNNAGTSNITILNNSNKINGVLDTALLDVNAVAAVFVYTGSMYGWRLG